MALAGWNWVRILVGIVVGLGEFLGAGNLAVPSAVDAQREFCVLRAFCKHRNSIMFLVWVRT